MATRDQGDQDEAATIATNSHSIVSKRSVEKLYFPTEPSFLEPFVPTFKRRAPLINRGYWLRMRAIETVVIDFITRPDSSPKFVINLGCGYDPLPFRIMHKGIAQETIFVDVDYKDLIRQKVNIILAEDKFQPFLATDLQVNNDSTSPLILNSASYCAVGVDLADTSALSHIFSQIIPIRDSRLLFIAEVSVTYMSLGKANALLKWSASFENAHFCILEQFLPAGKDHPFAKTMLDHFAKQQAPIQSVEKYQTLDDHRQRFQHAGWRGSRARSLWDYWEDPRELSRDEKSRLDAVEPFDEWEEFILFASHYFLLIAFNNPFEASHRDDQQLKTWGEKTGPLSIEPARASRINAHATEQSLSCVANAYSKSPRRCGQAVQISSTSVAVIGGIHNSSHFDVYTTDFPVAQIPALPNSILCGHTVTNLGSTSFLLVGGRTSPSRASSECYLLTVGKDSWIRVEDIQPARYRHCAVPISIGSFQCVLVFGGRTGDGNVLDDWQLWLHGYGWFRLHVPSSKFNPKPHRFGHTMLATAGSSGILVGGMDLDRNLCEEQWRWSTSLGPTDEHSLRYGRPGPWGCIALQRLPPNFEQDYRALARFGATLLTGGILIGGVAPVPLSRTQEVIRLGRHEGDLSSRYPWTMSPRPLLIGSNVFRFNNDEIIITGGGAVCFSFGSCMNTCWYRLRDRLAEVTPSQAAQVQFYSLLHGSSTDEKWELVPRWNIHEVQTGDVAELEYRVSTVIEPCVVRGVNPGSCLYLWSLDYLESQIGKDTKISTHHGNARNLQFHPDKNFSYEICTFSDFRRRLETHSHVYLRALASSSPFRKAANLERDFPSIAQDFLIPDALARIADLPARIHSSVLRVSGDVAIWLHYDVMSNFLFQIKGSKIVILFPPTAAVELQVAPGATVSTMDISDIQGELLNTEKPARLPPGIEGKAVTLRPGDVLFIPRFWLHTTLPSAGSTETSVAVNVFCRDLENKHYAAGRDVYGNRDLAVYENCRNALKRIQKAFGVSAQKSEQGDGKQQGLMRTNIATFLQSGDKKGVSNTKPWKEAEQIRRKFLELPKDVASFYLPRLAAELLEMTGD